jgi:hypothetical protein
MSCRPAFRGEGLAPLRVSSHQQKPYSLLVLIGVVASCTVSWTSGPHLTYEGHFRAARQTRGPDRAVHDHVADEVEECRLKDRLPERVSRGTICHTWNLVRLNAHC